MERNSRLKSPITQSQIDLATRLRDLRLNANMSLADVASRIGISKVTLSRYETLDIVNIPSDNIELLSNVYNVSPSYIMGWDKSEENADTSRQYPFIPDAVAAGIPCTIEGRKKLPTIGISDTLMGKYAGNKHIVIMKVNGESMNRVIPNGSFVAVKTDIKTMNLKDGDLVVFGKEHEYSLKRFYDIGDKIIFKPDSDDPRFADQVYGKDDSVFIVGRVVVYMVNLI